MDYINEILAANQGNCPYYQPIGKLFWTKLANGDIIRVRCKSVYTLKGHACLVHEYEGADGNTYIGSAFGIQTCYVNGHYHYDRKLYINYEDCKCNHLTYEINRGYYGTNANAISLFKLIADTYNDADARCVSVSSMGYVSLNGYKVVNGKITKNNLNFAIWVDENGEHFDVMEFDNQDYFLSEKMAYSHYNPKVIDFGDNDSSCDVKKTITITITICEEQKRRLADLGLI